MCCSGLRISTSRVGLDVAGGDFALACGLDIDGLGAVAVEAGDDALHVQHDLRDVLLDAGDGGKLMLHTGDLDGGAGSAGQGERRTLRRELPSVVP